MNFFKRIGILIYMLLMIGAGALLIVVPLDLFSAEDSVGLINFIRGDIVYQASVISAGAVFVLIGLIASARMFKGLEKSRIVAFQNPDGEVTVSLSAIEDYVRKVAKGIPDIKDVRPNVNINKKGINIVTSVSINSGTNIPELTERIQMEVKSRIQAMLGLEERINIKMHIGRILKGANKEEKPLIEEINEPEHIPYREM